MDKLGKKLIGILLLLSSINIYSMFGDKVNVEPVVLRSQELVKKISDEKLSQVHWLADILPGLYAEYEQKYVSGERNFFPHYEPAGGMNYLMNLSEMKTAIASNLHEMYQNGKIMTRSDFAKLDQEKWFKRYNNLTRIWGARYLEKKFRETRMSSFYKVPEYIIVVDDLSDIKIRITFDHCFPIIHEIINGTVYAQKITGQPTGAEMKGCIGFGFTDYNIGNILRADDGINFVVDTEYNSFNQGQPEYHLFRGKMEERKAQLMCFYFKRRFMITNGIDELYSIISFCLNQSISKTPEQVIDAKTEASAENNFLYKAALDAIKHSNIEAFKYMINSINS